MHAVVITAYKDFPSLLSLLEELHSREFLAFVHIDARSEVSTEVMRTVESLATVRRTYAISWGSRNHLLAIVDLMRLAVGDTRTTYVHTVSGQDFPIASALRFDEVCDGRIFMRHDPLAHNAELLRWRFAVRRLLESDPIPISLVELGNRVVKKLHRKSWSRLHPRTRSFPEIHFGLVWMSLPRDVAEYVTLSTASHTLLRELKRVWISEEFYFQTLVMTSPFKSRVVADNVRYRLGAVKHGTRPGILDLEDLASVRDSGALFARKFDSHISGALLRALKKDMGV